MIRPGPISADPTPGDNFPPVVLSGQAAEHVTPPRRCKRCGGVLVPVKPIVAVDRGPAADSCMPRTAWEAYEVWREACNE